MKTLLVFTGAVSREDCSKVEKKTLPHYLAESVSGILTCSQ